MKSAYRVSYRVNNSSYQRVLQLDGPSESQAMYELKRSGALPYGATVIILDIEPAY